ncbi:MAG: hypothetical protein HYZ53_21625 [Planctomycetes bacterium]|nr:hypothetical protein [Planctomycetota bacterium]
MFKRPAAACPRPTPVVTGVLVLCALGLGLGLALESLADPPPAPAAPEPRPQGSVLAAPSPDVAAHSVDLPARLPANTLAYLSLRDLEGVRTRVLGSLLAGFPASERAARQARWSAAWEDLLDGLGARSNLDLRPLLRLATSAHVALLDLRMDETQPVPQVLVAIETSDPAALETYLEEAFDDLQSDGGGPDAFCYRSAELSGEGLPFDRLYAVAEGGTCFLATAADLLARVASTARPPATAPAPRATDESGAAPASQPAPSLATTPAFAAGRAAAPAEAAFFLHANLSAVLDALERGLSRGDLREYQRAEAFFGFRALATATAWVVPAQPDLQAGLRVTLSRPNELYDALRQPPRALTFPDAAPAGTCLAIAFALGDAPATWTAVRKFVENREESFEERPEDRKFAAAVESYERKLGQKLERLLAEATGELALWARPRAAGGGDEARAAGAEPAADFFELDVGYALRVAHPAAALDALEHALAAGEDRPSLERKRWREAEARVAPSGRAFTLDGAFVVGSDEERSVRAYVEARQAGREAGAGDGASARPGPGAGAGAGAGERHDDRPSLASLCPRASVAGWLELQAVGRRALRAWERHEGDWWGGARCVVGFGLEEREDGVLLSAGAPSASAARLAGAAAMTLLEGLTADWRRQDTERCVAQMVELGTLVREYRERSADRAEYPASLEALGSEFNLDDSQFLCPVRARRSPEPPAEARYVYLYPFDEDSTPPGRILVYEAGANHDGRHVVVHFDLSTTEVTAQALRAAVGPQVSELKRRAVTERTRLEGDLRQIPDEQAKEEGGKRLGNLARWEADYAAVASAMGTLAGAEDGGGASGRSPPAPEEVLGRLRSALAELDKLRPRTPMVEAELGALRRRLGEAQGK